jgi:hypothetical protein
MRAQSIPVTGLPGPREPVFSARIVITEQEGVCTREWNYDGDASIGTRVQKLLDEIVAER